MLFNTGKGAYFPASNTIDRSDFGAIYTGFRDFRYFEDQIIDTNVGRIVWPGGFLAEQREDRFGLEHDDLQVAEGSRVGLSDIIQFANDEGMGLSVVQPTFRYRDVFEQARVDVREFMSDFLSGKYGHPPEDVTFDIGSEYYAHFSGPDRAAEYGQVANAMVEEIAKALNDPAVNQTSAHVDIAVQMGKYAPEDVVIRDQFSALAKQNIDLIIHNRFVVEAEGFDRTAAEVKDKLADWNDDIREAGGESAKLSVSGFNVFSYTRNEAVDDYVAAKAEAGENVDPQTIDLAGRTNSEFEQFYQDHIRGQLGTAHPRVILEGFSEYQKLNMEHATLYGFDVQWAGRVSFTDANGDPQNLIGSTMYDMIAESVIGTRQIDLGFPTKRGDDVWSYGFENEDKLIIFMAAGQNAPGKVDFSLNGFGTDYTAFAAERLTGEIPSDWMERFGITDNPNVDETSESRSFTFGKITSMDPVVKDDGITFRMNEPYEVVRFSIAKTDKGLEEIQSFTKGQIHEIPEPAAPVAPEGPDGPDGPGDNVDDQNDGSEDQDQDDEEDDADKKGGGGGSCFVATAAYGDPWHTDVKFLRSFRDQFLINYRLGRRFVAAYWIIGPVIARHVSPDRASGKLARFILSRIVAAIRRFWRAPQSPAS